MTMAMTRACAGSRINTSRRRRAMSDNPSQHYRFVDAEMNQSIIAEIDTVMLRHQPFGNIAMDIQAVRQQARSLHPRIYAVPNVIIRDPALPWSSRDDIQRMTALYMEIADQLERRVAPDGQVAQAWDLEDSDLFVLVIGYVDGCLERADCAKVEAAMKHDAAIRWVVKQESLTRRLARGLLRPLRETEWQWWRNRGIDPLKTIRAFSQVTMSPARLWRAHLYKAGLLQPLIQAEETAEEDVNSACHGTKRPGSAISAPALI
ncbi:MAG: hypothetical protein R3F54_29605 [Alphaproteobacteria bacterium]